jgi:hypothetical protein
MAFMGDLRSAYTACHTQALDVGAEIALNAPAHRSGYDCGEIHDRQAAARTAARLLSVYHFSQPCALHE